MSPARNVQRHPFEGSSFIEQQAYDNDRDECSRRVPDDAPNDRYVGQRDDPREQRQDGPAYRAPPDSEPLGLPDDEHDRDDEDQDGKKHQAMRWPEASTTCCPSSFANAPR